MVFERDLGGRYVVVSGGSRGIGEHIVRQAREAGAVVSFTYSSNREAAENVANETGATPLQLSLGDRQSTQDFLDNMRGVKAIDYFIANAGAELSGSLAKHTWDEMDEVFDANIRGNAYLVRDLITEGHMAESGQITMVGSIASQGNHDQLAYSMSKAALSAAAESLSRYDGEVDKQQLGILTVEPAFVRTPMAKRVLRVMERRMQRDDPSKLARFIGSGYVMEPEDAAGQILTLTVDPSVTGVQQIPEGADLHAMRQTYFGE